MVLIAASDTRLKFFFLGSPSGVQAHSSMLHASPSEEHSPTPRVLPVALATN